MPITERPASSSDIEAALAIEPKSRGDALVGPTVFIDCWKRLLLDPFCASAVLESNPPIAGYRLVGFGFSVLVSARFADAELTDPRPDITSRIIASIHAGSPVLATAKEVAEANAEMGVNIVVLAGHWREAILSPTLRSEVQTILASGFTQRHTGYRIRRIFQETTNEPQREFLKRSIVFKPIADFPELDRTIYIMTSESVQAVQASFGNVLFSYREPCVKLRNSDQKLLLAALSGATDPELAAKLGVSFSAVKARWRSIFARIGEAMPSLLPDFENRKGRGAQQRHRIIAYVRSHPEELRPYNWESRREAKSTLPQRTSLDHYR